MATVRAVGLAARPTGPASVPHIDASGHPKREDVALPSDGDVSSIWRSLRSWPSSELGISTLVSIAPRFSSLYSFSSLGSCRGFTHAPARWQAFCVPRCESRPLPPAGAPVQTVVTIGCLAGNGFGGWRLKAFRGSAVGDCRISEQSASHADRHPTRRRTPDERCRGLGARARRESYGLHVPTALRHDVARRHAARQ